MAITKDCQLMANAPYRASDVAQTMLTAGRVDPETARALTTTYGVAPHGVWFYRASQAAYNIAKEADHA